MKKMILFIFFVMFLFLLGCASEKNDIVPSSEIVKNDLNIWKNTETKEFKFKDCNMWDDESSYVQADIQFFYHNIASNSSFYHTVDGELFFKKKESDLLRNKCNLASPFTCEDYDINADSISLDIVNGLGTNRDIIFHNISLIKRDDITQRCILY